MQEIAFLYKILIFFSQTYVFKVSHHSIKWCRPVDCGYIKFLIGMFKPFGRNMVNPLEIFIFGYHVKLVTGHLFMIKSRGNRPKSGAKVPGKNSIFATISHFFSLWINIRINSCIF